MKRLIPFLIFFGCSTASVTSSPVVTPSSSPTPKTSPLVSPKPSASPLAKPNPSPSPIPSAVAETPVPTTSASPTPTLSPTGPFAQCQFLSTNPGSWIRQSLLASPAYFQTLGGCPIQPEQGPPYAMTDGRYDFQRFPGGMCMAWDWTRPTNYVAANYIPQACSGVLFAQDTNPNKPLFPIVVFQQPASLLATWASRGVNTISGFDGSSTYDAWRASIEQNNLFMIRLPQGTLSVDATDPRLLAWQVAVDEVDQTSTSPATVLDNYEALKAIAPTLPLYANFSGGGIEQFPTRPYAAFFAATDIISNDMYPVTGWSQPGWIDLSSPVTPKWSEGVVLDTISALTPKTKYAIIETSNQQLPWVPNDTGVTATQFRCELFDALIHGAKSIGYFADIIGSGWVAYDGTPADVVAEMTTDDAWITANAQTLILPAVKQTVPVPFEQAKFGSKTLTLNFSSISATLGSATYSPCDYTWL